jgi:hypothetical protein
MFVNEIDYQEKLLPGNHELNHELQTLFPEYRKVLRPIFSTKYISRRLPRNDVFYSLDQIFESMLYVPRHSLANEKEAFR